MLSILLNVRKLSKADTTTIRPIQLDRLKQLVNHSRRHSPYFSTLYKNLPAVITDISQLPITTKPELMNNFDNWVTDKEINLRDLRQFVSKKETIGDLYLRRYYVCTTSGTTGHPAVIVHDLHSRKVYYAIGFFRNLLPRLSLPDIFTRVKMAAVLATDGHFLGYTTLINRAKKSKLRQRLQKVFSVFTPVPLLVKGLNEFQPDILGGYPTMIYLLAKEQLQKRLNIHPYLITSSGETLHPYMRKTMQDAFGSVVMNSYGSSEVPGLTSECKYHKLHVNTDWYILEVEDNDSILVTNLSNFVQPIIRYQMNDYVVVESEPCRCGSKYPVVSVVGRDDEILTFLTENGESIDILPMAISTIAEESKGVYQSQIVQKTNKHIIVRIKPIEGEDAAMVKDGVKANMEEFFAAHGLSHVMVELAEESPEINPKSGKFRSVVTLVKK